MSSSPTSRVDIDPGIRVPLRDGVHLQGTLYKPAEQAQPAPCILAMTPYGVDLLHERAAYVAARGMPFLVLDVRGRGGSEGVFKPFTQEGCDGYDAVEWLARQPFCNGQVAMQGGSYSGYVQWAVAKEGPPHLAGILPRAPVCAGVDFPMRNNIFQPYALQWLTLTSGRACQNNWFADGVWWITLIRQWYESGRPFRELADRISNVPAALREWLAHPELDAYWDALRPTPEQYARLEIPILTITGSYDSDQIGALEYYRDHVRHAAGARDKHYLIIGPWDHARTGAPSAEFAGMKFGPASVIDMGKLCTEWYAWTMQGGAKPEFLRKPVAYYVMGAECWRYADTLEAITSRHESWFLDSCGRANDVFSSGTLQESPAVGEPDSYAYDPRDTRHPAVDIALHSGGLPTEQKLIIASVGRQLVYHSAPFEQDAELSGFFKLSVWLAIDRPDADFYVSVSEIGLDGGSILLATDSMRARYREGLRVPKPIHTREPLCYDFKSFTFVSRQVKCGHRLRLVIASLDGGFALNYHGGGIVVEESSEVAKTVTVRLFHDQSHPSALQVPFGQTE